MLRTIAIFAAGLIVGIALMSGYMLLGSDHEEHIDETDLAAQDASSYMGSESQEEAVPAPNGVDEDESICEETLAMVRDAHESAIEKYSANEELVDYLSELVEKSGAAAPEGVAMDFPEMLDDVFYPENFEDAFEVLQEECPDVFGEDSQANCDEYPCSIEFSSDIPAHEMAQDLGCPAYREQFGRTAAAARGFDFGDDEHYLLFMPTGTGVGLDEHLREHQGNMQRRVRHRWDEMRKEVGTEHFEEACVVEHDAEACRKMSRAYWGDPESQEVYFQIGCESDDASSCSMYADTRCVQRGVCDASAEHHARRGVELDGETGSRHRTLAIVLCERGAKRQADRSWERGCALGDEDSCGRGC